jgi:uncharacterized protein with HEPN domain
MPDAAQTVCEFTTGVIFEQYLKDRKLQLAVERSIEIIGEAARRVSEAFKQAHLEIPWRLIIAQIKILTHEYGEIKQDRMWLLATVHIPDLIEKLRPLIPPLLPEVEE